MLVNPILAVTVLMKLVAVLFVLVAVALILVILIQKGRGGGLSSALGGGGAGGVLGTKTGDFLTWVTIGLVSLFLLLAVLMAKYYKPSDLGGQATETSAPAETNQPAETPTPVSDDLGAAEANAAQDTAAATVADVNALPVTLPTEETP